MNAACLDLGVPPPTTACFTFGVWRPKVPGSPTRYIQRNFLLKVSQFWAEVASTEMLVGEYVIKRKRITFFPVSWHWIKIPDCTGCRWEGFVRRRASFCGRRWAPAPCWAQAAPDGSAAGPPQDTAEPFNQTGGTSVKTYLRPENTDGGSIRGGNEGAEKGGMNKNNDKKQREHHS